MYIMGIKYVKNLKTFDPAFFFMREALTHWGIPDDNA